MAIANAHFKKDADGAVLAEVVKVEEPKVKIESEEKKGGKKK